MFFIWIICKINTKQFDSSKIISSNNITFKLFINIKNPQIYFFDSDFLLIYSNTMAEWLPKTTILELLCNNIPNITRKKVKQIHLDNNYLSVHSIILFFVRQFDEQLLV